ncbi:MAG: addiction module toxin RelE, partial [Sphingobacteriaceae bacterium]
MINSVFYSPEFKINLKPLAKKYFTLKQSIKSLEEDLIKNPYLGESYGEKIYKIR